MRHPLGLLPVSTEIELLDMLQSFAPTSVDVLQLLQCILPALPYAVPLLVVSVVNVSNRAKYCYFGQKVAGEHHFRVFLRKLFSLLQPQCFLFSLHTILQLKFCLKVTLIHFQLRFSKSHPPIVFRPTELSLALLPLVFLVADLFLPFVAWEVIGELMYLHRKLSL
jgi:hypothetical protein